MHIDYRYDYTVKQSWPVTIIFLRPELIKTLINLPRIHVQLRFPSIRVAFLTLVSVLYAVTRSIPQVVKVWVEGEWWAWIEDTRLLNKIGT